MSFPTYSAYKNSRIDWIGQIPSHWSTIPLAKVATQPGTLFIDGDWVESKDLADEGIRYITTGNVGRGQYKEQGSGYVSEDTFAKLGCTEVKPGDVLISRLNLPVGRACVVPELGERIITSVDNVITRPNKQYSCSYISYMLSSKQHFANMEVLARGTTMQRISRSTLGHVRFALPELDEQTEIAKFLDKETAKIDALISEQERLIELLQEKRKAFISHAVTKGLNPDAPMKDSGVEWLGEVPEHWAITRLDRVGEFEAGKAHEPFVSEGGIYAIANARFVSTNGKAAKHSDVQLTPALKEDILMVMSDLPNGRALARAYHVGDNEQIAVNQRVCRIRIIRGSSRFYYYFLNRNPGLLWFNDGANQTHIPNSGFTKLVVLEPPVNEQLVIAEMLDSLNTETDRLMESAEDMSKLLVERRSALISAAVTGQIDVRGLVAEEEAA